MILFVLIVILQLLSPGAEPYPVHPCFILRMNCRRDEVKHFVEPGAVKIKFIYL
jgi:hypothetical protein